MSIPRAKHPISPELRAAVIDYYAAMGQKLTSMRLIEYYSKPFDIHVSEVLVRFTDADGFRVAAVCDYDGWDGQLRKPEKPCITEGAFWYVDEVDLEKCLICYMDEEEDERNGDTR